MRVKTLLVTGSSGLIGSEVVEHFSQEDWTVHGVDNNMWADFFGPGGDTRWNTQRLKEQCPTFQHHELDIRDRAGLLALLKELRPNAIVHTATQPSPDLAASRPFENFDLNAVGTLNLLEAACQSCPEAAFVHMSAIMRCPKRNCAH